MAWRWWRRCVTMVVSRSIIEGVVPHFAAARLQEERTDDCCKENN